MRAIRLVLCLLAALLSVIPDAIAKIQVDPEIAREIQSGLADLGYFRGNPSGTWDDPTNLAAQFFLEDVSVDYGAATSGDMLILRNALREALARKARSGFEPFVATRSSSYDIVRFSRGAAISKDGKLAITSEQESVILWDLASHRQLGILKLGCCVGAATLSADGTLAAYVQRSDVRIWNIEQARMEAICKLPEISGISVSGEQMRFLPDGSGLVVGDDRGRLSVCPFGGAPTRLVGQHFAPKLDTSIYGSVRGLDVSPDGKLAASITPYDGTLKIWDLGARKLLRSVKLYAPTREDVDGGLEYNAAVLVTFDQTGKTVTVAQAVDWPKDGATTKLHRIDLASGKPSSIDIPQPQSLAASPDRDTVAVGLSKSVEIYDTADWREISQKPTIDTVLAMTEQGRIALTGHRAGESGAEQFGVADLQSGSFVPLADSRPLAIKGFAPDDANGRLYLGAGENQLFNLSSVSGEVSALALDDGSAAKKDDASRISLGAIALRPDGSILDVETARLQPPPKDSSDERTPEEVISVDPSSGKVTRQEIASKGSVSAETFFYRNAVATDASLVASTFAGEYEESARAFVSVIDTRDGSERTRIELRGESNDPLGIWTGCKRAPCTRRLVGPDAFDAIQRRTPPVALSSRGDVVYAGLWEPIFSAYDVASGSKLGTFDTSLPFRQYMPDAHIGRDPSKGWEPEVAERVGRSNSIPRLLLPVPGRDEVIAILGAPVMYISRSGGFMLRFGPGSSAPTQIMTIPSPPDAAAISSDASKVALGYSAGLSLIVDADTGSTLSELRGGKGKIGYIAFSADGTKVYAYASDGALRIWSTGSGELLATTYLFEPSEWLTITPEGFFAGSRGGSAELLLRTSPRTSMSVDQVYQALYRPDLVREKLAGDPDGKVKEAAVKLDLSKVLASGPAPKVTIVSPSAATAASGEDITVEASVTDQGGGVGKIEWRVNGVTLGVEERGLSRVEASGNAPAAIKKTLTLTEGENRIEIVAYNGQDLIASTPAEITVTWDGETGAAPPKLYVLTVGVNDYWDSRLKLNYAVPDAKALADAFGKAGDKLYGGVEIKAVEDAGVTRANLDQVFAELAKQVHARDTFVFFLAGHGKTVDGRYYFLPQDFRYEGEESIAKSGIGQDTLQGWFAQVPARKSVLLFDTCESGTLTGERVAQRGLERVASLERMTRAMGRTVLSASTDDAPALEGYRGHGVFTYALLDGLGASDANGNGTIEVTELAGFVDQKVPELSFAAFKQRQVPQMKLVGSNFAVANKVAALAPEAEAGNEALPSKPTHVVVAPADVFKEAGGAEAAIAKLAPGTSVAIVRTEAGWTLVAKDGKALGYVAGASLAPIQ
jgi:uncharacterized caspase-like protein/WD40 repeat protein